MNRRRRGLALALLTFLVFPVLGAASLVFRIVSADAYAATRVKVAAYVLSGVFAAIGGPTPVQTAWLPEARGRVAAEAVAKDADS